MWLINEERGLMMHLGARIGMYCDGCEIHLCWR